LAIDTSSGTSVAVSRDGNLLAEANHENPMGHAENIGEAIAEALSKAGVKPNEIGAVVVGRGPAPFTGLRVGIAAAVAFAEGIGVQLYGVVSHDAIAMAHFATNSKEAAATKSILVVRTDARRREEYWSAYSGVDENGLPRRIEGPGVASAEVIEERLSERGVPVTVARVSVSAGAIASLAAAAVKTGQLSTDVSALYLRAPDATEPKPHGRVGKSVSG
jgi:tRNA threonylcarbamoyl adenosine modification protein YeaZ